MAADDTNALTMKLLGLLHYVEGPKANEIRAVITALPAAAYHERNEADEEISHLKEENGRLKQRLAQEVLGSKTQPPQGPRYDDRRPTRFDMTPSTIKREYDDRPSSISTTTGIRNPRLSAPRELFPDGSSPWKRPRERSPPPPPTRKRPECVGCFQISGTCDGRPVCSCCAARNYGCEYRECWDGDNCCDQVCTRLHPDQWDPATETRKVKKSYQERRDSKIPGIWQNDAYRG